MKRKEKIMTEDPLSMSNSGKIQCQNLKSQFEELFAIWNLFFGNSSLTFINLISTLLNRVYNFIRIFSYPIPILRLTQDYREKTKRYMKKILLILLSGFIWITGSAQKNGNIKGIV